MLDFKSRSLWYKLLNWFLNMIEDGKVIRQVRDLDAELISIVDELGRQSVLIAQPLIIVPVAIAPVEISMQWVTSNTSNLEDDYANA